MRTLLAVVVTALLSSMPAVAHGPGIGPVSFDLDLRGQLHGALLATLVPDDPASFGGVEGYFAASIYGFGATASLGYAYWYRRDGARHGGYLELGLQWRFMALAGDDVYRYVDPHLGFGGRFGGISAPGEADFLGTFYLDAGLTLGLGSGHLHPALVVRYRYEPARAPSELPAHAVLFGLGLRAVD